MIEKIEVGKKYIHGDGGTVVRVTAVGEALCLYRDESDHRPEYTLALTTAKNTWRELPKRYVVEHRAPRVGERFIDTCGGSPHFRVAGPLIAPLGIPGKDELFTVVEEL